MKNRAASPLAVFLLACCFPTTAVATESPVLEYRLDEGRGSRVADSVSREIGTIAGARWTRGVRGTALEFNGVGDHVVLAGGGGSGCRTQVCNLSMGTLSIWFRFDSIPAPSNLHTLVYIGDGEGDASPYGFVIEVGHYRGDRRLFFTLYNGFGTPGLCFDTGFGLEIGRWYHFALVIGQDFNTGYLDGEELVDRVYSFGGSSDRLFFSDLRDLRAFWLGRGWWSVEPSYLDGALDEFAIFDRPFSAEEVRDLYLSVAPSFIRGDADGDAATTISDAVAMLRYLFLGAEVACLSAADANGDEQIDVSDAVRFLVAEFARGEPLAPPYPNCEPFPTTWSCERTACPNGG